MLWILHIMGIVLLLHIPSVLSPPQLLIGLFLLHVFYKDKYLPFVCRLAWKLKTVITIYMIVMMYIMSTSESQIRLYFLLQLFSFFLEFLIAAFVHPLLFACAIFCFLLVYFQSHHHNWWIKTFSRNFTPRGLQPTALLWANSL